MSFPLSRYLFHLRGESKKVFDSMILTATISISLPKLQHFIIAFIDGTSYCRYYYYLYPVGAT